MGRRPAGWCQRASLADRRRGGRRVLDTCSSLRPAAAGDQPCRPTASRRRPAATRRRRRRCRGLPRCFCGDLRLAARVRPPARLLLGGRACEELARRCGDDGRRADVHRLDFAAPDQVVDGRPAACESDRYWGICHVHLRGLATGADGGAALGGVTLRFMRTTFARRSRQAVSRKLFPPADSTAMSLRITSPQLHQILTNLFERLIGTTVARRLLARR